MADLVDLAGAKIIRDEQKREDRREAIGGLLRYLVEANDKGEIRTLLAVEVRYTGSVNTHVDGEMADRTALVGTLEIAKNDVIAVGREIGMIDVPEET